MADTFWMVEEAVGRGLYMLLDGIYGTKDGADKARPKNSNSRAALYETGHGNQGPVRVHRTSRERTW
jgi:hypothetical protein